jgi:hypothetical protein
MCTIVSTTILGLLSFWTSSGIWPKKKLNNTKCYGLSSEVIGIKLLIRIRK